MILKGFWDFFIWGKRTKIGLSVVFGLTSLVGQYFIVGYFTRPSFVFLVPGAWLDGNTWDFIVNHRGPKTNYRVEMLLVDEDRRKAVLAAHSTLTSSDIESYQKRFRYPEINPRGRGSIFATQLQWRPLNPDHEHYTLVITTRELNYQEELNIERVDGKWVWAMKVTSQEGSKPLLSCGNKGFPYGPDAPQTCFPSLSQPSD